MISTTQPCLSWTLPPFPNPFALFFPIVSGISISFPPPGINLPCCKFNLPAFTIQIPIALIIPPTVLAALMIVINTITQAYLAVLPFILIPNCNF